MICERHNLIYGGAAGCPECVKDRRRVRLNGAQVILFVILFAIKVGGADYSWWVVFSPFIVPFVAEILLGAIYALITGKRS